MGTIIMFIGILCIALGGLVYFHWQDKKRAMSKDNQ